MINITISNRVISASAIARKWPGAIIACKRAGMDTLIEWDETVIPARTETEIKAAQDEYDVFLVKDRINTPILAQIVEKDKQIIRSTTELSRARDFGDVPADVVTAARARFKELYDEREALRAQLQK